MDPVSWYVDHTTKMLSEVTITTTAKFQVKVYKEFGVGAMVMNWYVLHNRQGYKAFGFSFYTCTAVA